MSHASIRQLRVRHESWPLAAPFRISRGVKTAADLVVVELALREGGHECRGWGECVPYGRYGESVDSVIAAIEAVRGRLEAGVERAELLQILPAGAARNAIDAALWDFEAKRQGHTVAAILGLPSPRPVITAHTVSLDTPERMAQAAAQLASVSLIKVKVDAHDPVSQIAAVHTAAPHAALIVDANEGWDFRLLCALQEPLVKLGAVLVEQPLPAGADDILEGFTPLVPLCADESCHTIEDLPRVRRRYQAVNIKLDKSGGLTAAVALARAAGEAGLQRMIGCMVCSSLGIAPALQLAAEADFIDLDGPLLLAQDREGGVTMREGRLQPARQGFWGDPA